jgi:hypothetical protein
MYRRHLPEQMLLEGMRRLQESIWNVQTPKQNGVLLRLHAPVALLKRRLTLSATLSLRLDLLRNTGRSRLLG